ncbi:MAG: DUF2442 domain-containing protein [Proteobacteria bacterium]|nr:DUF2442 domain-containing protein [Pseudomonadota bacterium]
MNDLHIKSVSFSDRTLNVEFADGRCIELPLELFAKLNIATPPERAQWRLIGKGLGVHWELLDEDVSLENLLLAYSRSKRGAYAQGVLV